MIHIKTCLYSSCTALHFKSPLWWCAEEEMQKLSLSRKLWNLIACTYLFFSNGVLDTITCKQCSSPFIKDKQQKKAWRLWRWEHCDTRNSRCMLFPNKNWLTHTQSNSCVSNSLLLGSLYTVLWSIPTYCSFTVIYVDSWTLSLYPSWPQSHGINTCDCVCTHTAP